MLPRALSLAALASLSLLLPACRSWKIEAGIEVVQRTGEWTEALRAHDTTALDSILASDFRLVFVEAPPGMDAPPIVDRDTYIANTQRMTFESLATGNANLTFQGRDLITSRMPMTLEGLRFDGSPIPGEYVLTDIWVRRDGRWVALQRISEDDKSQGDEPAVQ